MTERMHDDEFVIDDGLVERLLAAQQPALARLPRRRFPSSGTVNAVVLLGDDLYVRLPRVPAWADGRHRELAWLPRLGPHLPLDVPEPVAIGEPTDEFPFAWAVFRWIHGSTYAVGAVDEVTAAADLAGFVRALRDVPAP